MSVQLSTTLQLSLICIRDVKLIQHLGLGCMEPACKADPVDATCSVLPILACCAVGNLHWLPFGDCAAGGVWAGPYISGSACSPGSRLAHVARCIRCPARLSLQADSGGSVDLRLMGWILQLHRLDEAYGLYV